MRVSFLRLLFFAAIAFFVLIPSTQAAVFITIAPPPIPIYAQPPCPAEGFLWVPGYWAYDYDFDDYFWVPGTWVMAPEVGFFWTPGYWAWAGDQFVFYDGYWGPAVGFYGGINYGFGYFGEGYVGGRWDNRQFYYNQAVNNVNVTNVRTIYNNTTVIQNTNVTRVSYNGGSGGINARPTPQQEAIAHQRHVAPVSAQTQQVRAARSDPQLRASANLGKPPIAATPKPGAFNERGVVPARQAGAPYRPERNRAAAQPGSPSPSDNASRRGATVHPRDLPPIQRTGPPNTGNARSDQKYQKQQAKLQAQQERERQKLQQKQEQEHQRIERQAAQQDKRQQMEQRHQQQTQHLEQRQTQQWQKMGRREPPPQPQGRPPAPDRERPPQ